nr:hypothetical protein KK1_036345 [Ipomoea batatas]
MALASKLISTSMLLPPLFPGYKYSIPSNLLLVPLLTLSGFPNPKSTSYTLNLGELPTGDWRVTGMLRRVLRRWRALVRRMVWIGW